MRPKLRQWRAKLHLVQTKTFHQRRHLRQALCPAPLVSGNVCGVQQEGEYLAGGVDLRRLLQQVTNELPHAVIVAANLLHQHWETDGGFEVAEPVVVSNQNLSNQKDSQSRWGWGGGAGLANIRTNHLQDAG